MTMIDVPDTGGTSIYDDVAEFAVDRTEVPETVPSLSLDEIFTKYAIERCKLLKIDCEGAEFEILSRTKVLDRVEHLRGEIHRRALRYSELDVAGLQAMCREKLGPEKVRFKVID